MGNNFKAIQVLNDLININHDRVNGYKKAANEIKADNIDLQILFFKMANESWRHIVQLSEKIEVLGGIPVIKNGYKGTIYKVWKDLKPTFSGNGRLSVLESCDFSEEATKKTYEIALEMEEKMDVSTRKLLLSQQSSLKGWHYMVRKQRNINKHLMYSA